MMSECHVFAQAIDSRYVQLLLYLVNTYYLYIYYLNEPTAPLYRLLSCVHHSQTSAKRSKQHCGVAIVIHMVINIILINCNMHAQFVLTTKVTLMFRQNKNCQIHFNKESQIKCHQYKCYME